MDTSPAPVGVALDGELTIQVIAEQRARLLEALDAAVGRDLVLDLHAVHGCDSAGVQLLLSAHQGLQRQGRRLWLGPTSPTLNAVLRTYGLQAHFDRRVDGLADGLGDGLADSPHDTQHDTPHDALPA